MTDPPHLYHREPQVVYTTLARLLASPGADGVAGAVAAAIAAVEGMTAALCGTTTTLHEIWCAASIRLPVRPPCAAASQHAR